ncbi:hypothetical protein D6C97_06826 [Aureobasidium pullulans]|nr:hypothetical protein D6C97_06826 [Aureobasidium pullulans]
MIEASCWSRTWLSLLNEFHDQYVGSTLKRDAQLGKNNVCEVDDMVAMERCVLDHSPWLHLPTDRLGRQSGDSGTLLLLSLMAMRFIVDCAHNYLLGVPAAREGKTPSKDNVSGLIQWHAGRNLQYR